MSRLRIETPDQAQLTVERLYKDLERHIIASPPGLCPAAVVPQSLPRTNLWQMRTLPCRPRAAAESYGRRARRQG